MDNGPLPLEPETFRVSSAMRLPNRGAVVEARHTKPAETPRCPAGDCDWETRWRGPHPKVGETMVEYHRDEALHLRIARGLRSKVDRGPDGKPLRDKDGNEVVLWRLAVAPERERDEMYALVDVLRDRPLWLPHRSLWLWQPALCQRHEADHKAKWYEAVYPPNPPMPEERKRGRGPRRAANEEADDGGVPF